MKREDESTVHRGRRAEALAARHLEALGYTILERNFTCKGGELDIVARCGEYLCFVEVRYRTDRSGGEPLETVGTVKRGRLIRAARQFLNLHREFDLHRQLMRFDVVSVVGNDPEEMEVVQNAFEVNQAW